MHQELPKLLFFTSQIPQSRHAGSMQLYRALQGYPGDKLLVIGDSIAEGAELLPCTYQTQRLVTRRLVNTRFRRWAAGLNALDVLPEPGLERSLSLVGDFKPDLVVTVMDNLSYYKHAWKLARKLQAGLVAITMDDPQTFEVVHPLFQKSYDDLLRRLYGSAALSVGVSREMCRYIESEFGKPSEHLYFGPPEGLTPRPPDVSLHLKEPGRLTLGFAGSLSLGYPEGIHSLLPALGSTGSRLYVYSHYSTRIDHPCIVHRGFFPPQKLWSVIQDECDVVLLPYAFEGGILKLYSTHFPTKLSEYCWTGMPILVSGPDLATGVLWAKRHPEAALVATDPGIGSLLDQLKADGPLRASLAAGGAALARRVFDPIKSRERFQELILTAAKVSKGR